MTTIPGGCGIDACGRSECGNAKSDIEPRFSFSRPLDQSKNNPRDVFLKFDTYCFSSWMEIVPTTVEISENSGVLFNPAFDGTNFIFPYNGPNSKVRRPDSQLLSFWIEKVGTWPPAAKIIIRLNGKDEFGQDATKALPVIW